MITSVKVDFLANLQGSSKIYGVCMGHVLMYGEMQW